MIKKPDRRRQGEQPLAPLLLDPGVQEAMADPRFKHMVGLGDYTDPEAEELNYDRAMTLQAAAAVYTIRSAEKQGKTLARATWALVFATVGLVLVTVVLVVVTVTAR